jgi:hypothetical protein
MSANLTRRFGFDFDHGFAPYLRLIGVTPQRVRVEVDTRLRIRFGLWGLETPVANVTCARVTGPYRSVKAIGPRLSLADHGVSYGTNARRGLCILFREPVSAQPWFGLVKSPGATVTVADPEGLAAALGHPLEAVRR